MSEESFCALGVAAAARALRHLDWEVGRESLLELDRGSEVCKEPKLHFHASDAFRVTSAGGDPATLALPRVGDSICDWLADPVGFRILVLAVLAELHSGAKVPPLQQTWTSVQWQPPGFPSQAVRVRIVFPSTSGLVKLL